MDLEDELKSLTKEEFQGQLQEWIEKTNVAKTIQAKLRKDLIHNFNKTSLGRQIAFQHQQSQQLVLSPLVLALNTLVAEFLYCENCHYTLSVFSTETPYNNALPNFEKSDNYRFNNDELQEILEAVGFAKNSDVTEQTIQSYMTQTSGLTASLLYNMLRRLIDHNTKLNAKETTTNNQEAMSSISVSAKKPRVRSKNKRNKNGEFNKKCFKHLNRCLLHLTDQVSEIKQRIENAKKHSSATSSADRIDYFNKSIDRITETMQNLTKTNKRSRKLAAIIASITNLTNEISKCGESFEKLTTIVEQERVQLYNSNKSKPTDTKANKLPSDFKTYAEFIKHLKTSYYGKMYIEEMQQCQQKLVDKDRVRLEQIFENKLETIRTTIKFHYKQKMLEKCRNLCHRTMFDQRTQNNCYEIINDKLKSLKVQQDLVKKPADNMFCAGGDQNGNKRPSLSYHKSSSINIQPVKEQQSPSVHEKCEESQSEHTYAKSRLKEFENESEQFDKSFQKYLKRQEEDKRKLQTNVIKIWENYNFGKQCLSKHVVASKNYLDQTSRVESNHQNTLIHLQDKTGEMLPIIKTDNNVDQLSMESFDNAFKSITIEGMLQSKTHHRSTANEKKINEMRSIAMPSSVVKQRRDENVQKKLNAKLVEFNKISSSDQQLKANQIPSNTKVQPIVLGRHLEADSIIEQSDQMENVNEINKKDNHQPPSLKTSTKENPVLSIGSKSNSSDDFWQ